jgi:small subunit ribosomal protein S17
MKTVVGKVISDKMKDTVVVEIEWLMTHPIYSKKIHRSRKLHAHNVIGAKLGDKVRLVEIRPMSKTKNWKVEAIV